MKLPTVDVLIPSYLGERYLPHCLLALSTSSFTDYRAIVSIEGKYANAARTYAFARSLGITALFLEPAPRLGLAANRRRLLEASTADLVLWLDDDVLVSETAMATLVAAAPRLEQECCILTGVGSNLLGCPRVACALGFTLASRVLWSSCTSLEHDFGTATGEDWLWTSTLARATSRQVDLIPVALHHIGEHRRRKRYARTWEPSVFRAALGEEFYSQHQEELELSCPVYNYIDY